MSAAFIHRGQTHFNYRAGVPAMMLCAGINPNEWSHKTIVLSDPSQEDVERARRFAGKVVVDVSGQSPNEELLKRADVITCSNERLANALRSRGHTPVVIPDPYTIEELAPHAEGEKMVWCGLEITSGLLAWRRVVDITVVFPENRWVVSEPMERLGAEMAAANILAHPPKNPFVSDYIVMEALRCGLWAICGQENDFSEWVYVGSPQMGVEVSRAFRAEINDRVRAAQDYIRMVHDPEQIAQQWREVL